MLKPVRRLIAAHNSEGQSYIQEDKDAPNTTNTGGIDGYPWTELWAVDSVPADNSGNIDAADRPIKLQPPERGNVFRIVDIPPDTLRFGANVDQSPDTSAVAGSDAYAAGAGSRHPGFHKTRTVDYAIILDGEIVAMMDIGETVMRAGDVLIQRGTNHAWSNRTDKACRIAFILIDADSL
ncbi:MAG: cupin domain-containing protein [Alphaproteobacteria bacterium]|nr:cupin domain-containing protein [Alphaproteobacteria bacterium]